MEKENKKSAKLEIEIANKEYDPDCFINLKHFAIAIILSIAVGSLIWLLFSANAFLENLTL